MTKMVDRLVEHGLVERFDGPADRRTVKIRLTCTAREYSDHFLSKDAKCFQDLLERMRVEDCAAFRASIRAITDVFPPLPHTNEQNKDITRTIKTK